MTYTTATRTENAAGLTLSQELRDQLPRLITCPVGPAKGRFLLNVYRELSQDAGPEDAARNCRFAAFVLENLSWKDAADFANERNIYSAWFHKDRKELARRLNAEADHLAPAS